MRVDDERFLKRFKSDFEKLFPDGTTFNDIIRAVADNKLSIERDGPDITTVIDNKSIKEIEKVMPHLVKIIERPHSFIETYEDKTFVSTAKRINSKAISHLSRDSNDWFARTFLTVIPKNILSDIYEETVDLYENRFIVSFLDKILDVVIGERIKYKKIDERFKDEKAKNRMEKRDYGRIQNNSSRLSKKLLKTKQNSLSDDISHETITDYLEQIISLEKKIKHMKQSRLYSKLRKCRRVQNPIQKTNILTFDPRYNAAYRLWEYLDNIIPDEIITLDDPLKSCLPVWYVLFTLITFSCALNDMGFEPVQDSKLTLHENRLYLDKTSIWKRKDDSIHLSFLDKKNKLELKYLIDENKNKWDKILITPDFSIDFENKSLAEVREQSDEMINSLAEPQNKKNEKIPRFYFISIDLQKCSDNNDWGEVIYRRFFNIGDNYSNEEKNIKNLSLYQSGILIISPENFQVNFLRIQRLINSRILRNRIRTLDNNNCPICGEERLRRIDKKEIICDSCKHYISMSDCRKPDCNTQFLWIKYIDDNFLEDEEINSNFETAQYYSKLVRCENIMGEYAITSFSIEKDKSDTWKLYSLCPKCGRKLGE